ncbi:glycosyltransferase family 4 protein [Rugamonas rubra]|uniref:Glycosyltransferase involved in cell wall bisynthesis n=1 Tax=Rugamonas rubra TaxID=758825 RepID=A0A1I4KZJ3_9BURK|nr:glycosyltransferase family 4 protein [Rugamonas rubra]SFL84081.1 Glycosyltransferase involved in cell wall bisynthesis [Rugamonas rubra]
MRILRFMGYPINNFSTLERMMLAQASRLGQLGHQVEIVFDGIKTPAAAIQAQAFAPAVKLHFDLPSTFGLKRPRAMLAYLRSARRIIANGNFDIVHLYFDPGARLLNQLARLFPRVKFIRTIGSTPVPTGTRRYLDGIKRRKWVFDLSQMKRVICVGEHIGEMLVQFGLPADRVLVIPNATDIERFRRHTPAPALASAGLRLGFIGRLNPVKNIELIIRGMGVLVRQHQVRDVTLTLIGDGQMRAALEQLVIEESVTDYVRFAGPVSDIPGALNKEIDLYVQASHNEGCPAAVIEAMACEVPVLLSDIRGHRQVATPDVHGSYFAAGDTADFVRRVLQVRGNYGHYQRLAQQARTHIVATYGIDAWIAQELAAYTALLD